MLGNSIWHGFFMLLYPYQFALEAKMDTHFIFPMFCIPGCGWIFKLTRSFNDIL